MASFVPSAECLYAAGDGIVLNTSFSRRKKPVDASTKLQPFSTPRSYCQPLVARGVCHSAEALGELYSCVGDHVSREVLGSAVNRSGLSAGSAARAGDLDGDGKVCGVEVFEFALASLPSSLAQDTRVHRFLVSFMYD